MKIAAWSFTACVLLLGGVTTVSLHPPNALGSIARHGSHPLILDRAGQPIRASFQNEWNINGSLKTYEVPPFLLRALLASEDRRFYQHRGIDWRARAAAFWQNVKHGHIIRGASTIDEQVVRMMWPRSRGLWAKWLEGWEAVWLNVHESKDAILEFYLNQVPVGGQRRGFAQAAWFYFDRDLSTLTENEMLALTVIVRNPSYFDPRKNPDRVTAAAARLARKMEMARLEPLQFSAGTNSSFAPHFVRYVESQAEGDGATVRSTLDPALQRFTQDILDQYVRRTRFNVENGALLVVDHQTDEILAWSVAQGSADRAIAYDAVRVARQPGSSIKPFLYALAFENGFNGSSPIEDTPMEAAVGSGLHTFRNYSRTHYGRVTMREALANSLNIPAVRLMQRLGPSQLIEKMHNLGVRSLGRGGEFYGDGLALGNGEISLFEMTQAYAALARHGEFRPVRVLMQQPVLPGQQVFKASAANLVADILSDKNARRLEFGEAGTMNFPIQAAIKTGTSTDHRDAWAFAFNYRYVIGVWLGNLDNRPTQGLTGVAGPVVLARAVMNELTKFEETEGLVKMRDPGSQPEEQQAIEPTVQALRIVRPTPGMAMAIDPRVPRDLQAFVFEASSPEKGPIQWYLNGKLVHKSENPQWSWQLERGRFQLIAIQNGERTERRFIVK